MVAISSIKFFMPVTHCDCPIWVKLNEICRQRLRNRFNNDRESDNLLLSDSVEFNDDEYNTDVIFFAFSV